MPPHPISPEKTVLATALQAQYDAAALGFDWPEIGGVLDKIVEELEELREAVQEGDIEHARWELGDLFFAAISAARFLEVDPERCIETALGRFDERLRKVKQIADQEGRLLQSCPPDVLDAWWERAKTLVSQ